MVEGQHRGIGRRLRPGRYDCVLDESRPRAPGATARFKVYVVLTTANEKGSNTVSVTRRG